MRCDLSCPRLVLFLLLPGVLEISAAVPTQAATIVQWRSMRVHGAIGPLGIVLSPTAEGNGSTGPTVEPRSGGIQRIEVAFDQPVTLGNVAGISIIGRTTTGATMGSPTPYSPTSVVLSGASILQLNFAAGVLPDQTCLAITLPADVVAQGLTGDRDVWVRSLFADTTGDGRVNLSDVLAIRSRAGQSVLTQPQFDLDLSIGISQNDALLAKTRVTSPPHRCLCP